MGQEDLRAFTGLLLLAAAIALTVAAWRRSRGGRRRRVLRPGSGASGAIYELLNEDKRRAIEIIVEQRAEERDPETADGNLPDLEDPEGTRPRTRSAPRKGRPPVL